MTDRVKAHFALLGANLFYGAGYTVAKYLMPRLIQPMGFILIRVSIVALLFWLSYLGGTQYRAKIAKEDWLRLVLCGAFGVAANQLLFFLGLNLTYPIHASLIMMSTPLLITIIALFVLRERIKADKIAGLVIGIGGAVLLMSAGKEITVTGNSALGDLFVLLNAASYAIYLVIAKPLMQRYRPIIVIRWVFLFGFLLVLPFGYRQFESIMWASFEVGDFIALAFVVICCTFFTYLWNIYALKHISASTAGAYIYLQPIFASVISIIAIGEKITLVKILATIFIFAGVYLVNFGLKNNKLNDK